MGWLPVLVSYKSAEEQTGVAVERRVMSGSPVCSGLLASDVSQIAAEQIEVIEYKQSVYRYKHCPKWR